MFVATDVLAAEHTFKLYNNVRATMTSFRVRGAEVDGFSRTKGGETLTVRVIMPEGQCEGFVQAGFGSDRAEGRANICDRQGYVVTPGPGGLRFLRRSEVMLPN